MKKVLSVLLLLLVVCGYAQSITYENDHFILKGEKFDITDELVCFCEEHYNKISQKISKQPSGKIRLNIYPDLLSLRKSVNKEESTDYFINHCDLENFDMESDRLHVVSPYNPGPFHSALSVKGSIASDIESAFLCSCYNMPVWLVDNIGYYYRTEVLVENIIYEMMMESYLQSILQDESMFKIENIVNQNVFEDYENDYKTGNVQAAKKRALERRALSNSFIKYVIDNWGYEYLLQFNDDNSFEEVLGMSITDIESNWLDYIKSITL
jgi:hypothetical protein